MTINWQNIRTIQHSQNEGFEEFVCQLARKEQIAHQKTFIRKGKPDAGVECYWILENGDEWAWQAKFFTASFSDTQWTQITDSFKNALKKHENLKKYYIAFPIDPPDGRKDNQKSMLVKWEEKVKEWQKLATDKGRELEIIAWWSSDLIERLQRPENAGFTYFWFNKEEFTDEWFLKKTQKAIKDLGKRYIPNLETTLNFYKNLNLALEISSIFDGISRNKIFYDKIYTLIDTLLIKGGKIQDKILIKELKKISDVFDETEFDGIEPIKIDNFIDSFESITDIVDKIIKLDREIKSNKKANHPIFKGIDFIDVDNIIFPLETTKDTRDKIVHTISHFIELQDTAYIATTAFRNIDFKLANNPYLILEGEAGIGKSHLLADVVTKRNQNGTFSLFLLGQHFTTNEAPHIQIKKLLDFNCSFDDFLACLNAKAEENKQRLIIFIDAINEGRGKYFWEAHISGFIENIKKYAWLGLVISVRSSYSNLLVSKELLPETLINRYTHDGFSGHEYEASELFFNHFGIQTPSVPLLHPEFRNPLFLLLFCEGLYKSRLHTIPKGMNGITKTIKFFIDGVNKELSKPCNLNYSENINIVQKAIDKIIGMKFQSDNQFILYEDAYKKLNELSQEYSINETRLLDLLISEGIFSKNLYFINQTNSHEDCIYFSYERFEDQMKAKLLLDTHKNIDASFQENGVLHNLFYDVQSCYQNRGLLEALCIQLPERTGKEFFELAPYVKNEYVVLESFINSFLWRDIKNIKTEMREYINQAIIYSGIYELFLENCIAISSNPEHCFNGQFLHKNLIQKSLAIRDSEWTIFLKNKYNQNSSVKRLIDWASNNTDKSRISDESRELSAIMITWFFTSTNKVLRDKATKALVCLLKENINILVNVLKEFENVNDPYVYERLMVVAYGCAMTTTDTIRLKELSNYIYKTIFDKEGQEIYPHILVRDYARGIIEYTQHIFNDLELDIKKVRPPYKSNFFDKAPSNEDIDKKYKVPFKTTQQHGKDYLSSANYILQSMTTEYGRGICQYGDFGRYTFQAALHDWKVNPNEMSNIAVDLIFEKYGYDAELHGEFDRKIGTGRSNNTLNERIGKKYQWIALYEILARVSDNCKIKEDSSYPDSYDAVYDLYIRNIDPSLHEQNFSQKDIDKLVYNHWEQNFTNNHLEMTPEEWVVSKDDLPELSDLIKIVGIDNQEWLILNRSYSWREPKPLGQDEWRYSHKSANFEINSYLIKDDCEQQFVSWLKNNDGSWILESPQRNRVFYKEYYWSPAFKYFDDPYYNGAEKREIINKDDNSVICEVIFPSTNYFWENHRDNSIEGSMNILNPSKFIYDNMNLNHAEKTGQFINKKKELVCYSSIGTPYKTYLLVRKKEFLDFLKKEKLKVVWSILYRKMIFRSPSINDDTIPLEVHKIYSMDDKGSLTQSS